MQINEGYIIPQTFCKLKYTLKTDIRDQWVYGAETCNTTLIPILIPIHSFPDVVRVGSIDTCIIL